MDSYGGDSSGNGFPVRNSRAFNDPLSGGGGVGVGAERVIQPLAHYANSNGIASRPAGSRDDGVGGGIGGGGGRAQQPSHEVFMVREASRGSLGTNNSSDGRSPFASSGNRFQVETGGESAAVAGELYSQQQQRQPPHQQQSISHSSSHHRERSERDRDKERDHQQRQQLPLPKMLKVAVVGESTAGKTAICNAFTSEGYNFSRNYHMTTGVSIYAKSIKLPSSRLGGGGEMQSTGPEEPTNLLEPRINLVLVDSAGKPIYRELLPHYWDRLDGVALVLDLTSSTALESALDWLNLARGNIQKQKHVPPSNNGSGDQSGGGGGGSSKRNGDQSFLGVLIGSKTDLKDQRVISPKAAQDFASQHGLQYFECSAKDNNSIEEPFFYLAHQWTSSSDSSGGPADKENFVDGDVTAPSTGGIFARSGSNNIGGSSINSTSKRSLARQGSSSEAF